MAEHVGEALKRFFADAAQPILFTGAGVSVRTGLPTWRALIEQLAQSIRSKDPITTQQMLESVHAGDFALAVDYFKMSRKILEGDKRTLLVRLLSTFDANPIRSIARLPFRGCLTTNFDRSIFDAIAAERGTAARDFKYGDPSFKQAQWEQELFVARIHGAVEMPDSMVLSESQFKNLLEDDIYAELLGQFFMHRNLLFVGFSFYDPAVRNVFGELNKRIGAAAPGRHMVLVPEDIGGEFIQRANRLNIEVIQYSPDRDHAALWDAIDDFRPGVATTVSAGPKVVAVPFASTKRFLAACYARARMVDGFSSLRSAVAEGMVSAMLQEAAPAGLSRHELLEKLRLTLGVKGPDAEAMLSTSLKALAEANLCRKVKGKPGGEKMAWIGTVSESDTLDGAIAILTKSVRNRAVLQEGWTPADSVDGAVSAFFGHLIRRRGWDLGAAFAARRPPVALAIESLFNDCTRDMPAFDRQRLLRVAQTMFQHPSAEEAGVLAELGRVSFAVELAFQSPRSILLHEAILPRHIYFDASVLLPAIVTGHPFSPIYLDAIERLKRAAADAAVELKLRVCTVYLNEIISHRAAAEEYSAQVGNDFQKVAESDALYHGVTNVNVYVGAFANWVKPGVTVSFGEFLKSAAPYTTESELASWLKKKGFEIVKAAKCPTYPDLYGLLERASADKLSWGKRPVLIEHDATQLALLYEEAKRDEKSLFVTADRTLQQVAADSEFSILTELMISNIGLVQLIDLLVGGVTDGAGLTELLWSARISDRGQAVRAYFTARGLERYDDAMAMAMPKVIEAYAERATDELARAGIELDADDPRARAVGFQMLGSLEAGYLNGMSEAVAKLRKQLDGKNMSPN